MGKFADAVKEFAMDAALVQARRVSLKHWGAWRGVVYQRETDGVWHVDVVCADASGDIRPDGWESVGVFEAGKRVYGA